MMRTTAPAASLVAIGISCLVAGFALAATAGAAGHLQPAQTPETTIATQRAAPSAAPTTPVLATAEPPSIDASPDTIAAAGALAGRLNCPLCQGYTLRDCPLVVCAQMRELIVQKLAAGESEEAVVAYFVEQYGPQVLNQPLTSGFQLAAWVVPVAVLMVGFVVALVVVRRNARLPGSDSDRARMQPAAEVAPVPDPGADERARQLESMLGERR